jgi:Leucine-rich repeat (LRR) protein
VTMGNNLSQRLDRSHRTGILSLSGLGKSSLPRELVQELSNTTSPLLPLLKSVDLSLNKLSKIPLELGNLTQLRLLNLAQNKLRDISLDDGERCFGRLAKLETLDLRCNSITQLPSSMFIGLGSLKVLQLGNNGLTSLPLGLENLKCLVVLNCSDNKINVIVSNCFASMQATLEEVHLENNCLSELPDEFDNLSKLTLLNVNNNRLTKLPKGLLKIKCLKAITFDNNNITQGQFMAMEDYPKVSSRFFGLGRQVRLIDNCIAPVRGEAKGAH